MVPLVSCFFIFSKPHYLLIIVLFSILIILIVVSKVNKGYKLCKEHFFIGVAILLITPKMSVLQAVPTKYNAVETELFLLIVCNKKFEYCWKIQSYEC